MLKTAYFYDPTTKEYIGNAPTSLDPVASKREGRDVYLVPANATLTAIGTARDGYAQMWTGREWAYVEDHRGKVAWRDFYDSFIISDLGDIPAGCSLTRPEPPRVEKTKMYCSLVNSILTQKALEMGYDGVISILSYLSSTNAQWRAEAETFNAWRDSVWAAALPFINDFSAGKAERLTDDDFLSMLPIMPKVKTPKKQ